jgi:hypothetical protein
MCFSSKVTKMNENGNAAGAELSIVLAAPHRKAPLMSPVGRFVERASYTDLAAAGLTVLSLATAYFRWGPTGHTIEASERGLLDSAYFSFITFTSLGYGDLSPIGFGRFVAMLVVLSGLVLVALLVGKFASERQQAVLLLLHTSDCQRRLNDFSSDIDRVTDDLESAVQASQIANARSATKRLAARVEATSNYLVFNANQARLIEFGNESSLLALYTALARVQRVCVDVHKAEMSDLLISRRTRALANRSEGLVALMQRFHESTDQQSSYLLAIFHCVSAAWKTSSKDGSPLAQRVSGISTSMSERDKHFQGWLRTGCTPAALEQVFNATPAGRSAFTGFGIHKELAKHLNISNGLAQKCLAKLTNEGRLPKPVPKIKEKLARQSVPEPRTASKLCME